MTDEEKAEERTHKEYCDKCFNNLCKRNMNDKCFYSHTKDYLDGRAEASKESKYCIELLQNEKAELKKELYNLRQGVLMILHKNCTNRNEMYQDLERLYNGE